MSTGSTLSPLERSASPTEAPLAGRLVVLVHPAWHSCGSHKVFVTQALAYRQLGATLVSLAVADEPALAPSRQRRRYMDASPDLLADERAWTAMPARAMLTPAFADALRRRLHGDPATLRVAIARQAPLPDLFARLPPIDLVHCNHFFCMPVAERIAAKTSAPIVLDSQDVQARQYALGNAGKWLLPPAASFEAMLAVELTEMQRADLLLHFNDEETASFSGYLPEKHNALLYPAVDPAAVGDGAGGDLLIVAATNPGNCRSVEWFLREVVPRAPGLPYRIVGDIGAAIARRSPALFKAHEALFAGRVPDLAAAYRNAAAILLPTIAGHGISIKTIEALSCGAPLVATPQAFRGMRIDPSALGNVALADDAAGFAAAIRAAADAPPTPAAARRESATRRLYDRLFSADAYRRGLAALVVPLMQAGERPMPPF